MLFFRPPLAAPEAHIAMESTLAPAANAGARERVLARLAAREEARKQAARERSRDDESLRNPDESSEMFDETFAKTQRRIVACIEAGERDRAATDLADLDAVRLKGGGPGGVGARRGRMWTRRRRDGRSAWTWGRCDVSHQLCSCPGTKSVGTASFGGGTGGGGGGRRQGHPRTTRPT